MALFSSDKNTKQTKPKAPKKVAGASGMRKLRNTNGRLSGVIKAPLFSEKALIGTENGVYVFEVTSEATKTEIASAIALAYGVTPRKVRVANLPPKKVNLRTRRGIGTRARRHKAYVYLAKGDTLNLA